MTSASLDAAEAALTGGATDVALSPSGCFRYRLTLTNGQVTHEEITANNKVMLTWDYTATQVVMQRDADLDGFFEWRANIDIAAGVDKVVEVATERSPSNQALISRETYTRNSDTVHVLLERADSSGALRTVGEYDTPLFVSALSADGTSGSGAQTSLAATGCTAEQETLLRQRMKEAYDEGIHCLAGNTPKDPSTALDLARLRVHHKILLVCASLGTAPNGQAIRAQTQWLRVFKLFFIGNSEMKFDPSFFSESEQTQRKLMFHELLHLSLGHHENKSIELTSPRREEIDRIYSCASMCFDSNPNQCSCASCLRTKVCDHRCKPFAACSNTDLGAICPCESGSNAFRWFPTCSQCLSTCPSGLGCFGISTCIPVGNVSCNSTPVTCP